MLERGLRNLTFATERQGRNPNASSNRSARTIQACGLNPDCFRTDRQCREATTNRQPVKAPTVSSRGVKTPCCAASACGGLGQTVLQTTQELA